MLQAKRLQQRKLLAAWSYLCAQMHPTLVQAHLERLP